MVEVRQGEDQRWEGVRMPTDLPSKRVGRSRTGPIFAFGLITAMALTIALDGMVGVTAGMVDHFASMM